MISSRSNHHFSPDSTEEPAEEDGLQVDLDSLSCSLKRMVGAAQPGVEREVKVPGYTVDHSATASITALSALEHEYVIYLSDSSTPSRSRNSSVQSIASFLNDGTDNVVNFGRVQVSTKPTLAYADATKHIKHMISVSHEAAPLLMLPDLFDPSPQPDQEFTSLPPLAAALKLETDGRARVEGTLSARPCRDHVVEPGLVALCLKVTISLLSPGIFSPLLAVGSLVSKSQRRILSLLFPRQQNGSQQAEHVLTPAKFYAALKPAPLLSDELATNMQPAGLVPALLPFQRRSVAWLLQREGQMTGAAIPDAKELPPGWEKVMPLATNAIEENKKDGPTGESGTWYYNPLLGELRRTIPDETAPLGGMLCEEMGLGKTVECIAMILHHRALATSILKPSWRDEEMGVEVTPVNTTLIVTPPQLLVQWIDELARHAPTLRVFHYRGWRHEPRIPNTERDANANTTPNKKKRKRSDEDEDEDDEPPAGLQGETWNDLVREHDVVVTTYQILQKDLHFARPPVKRPRRGGRLEPIRKRSLLIMIQWARVIMDEVQLMGNANAQEMVSMIPRRASFAVSGTPVNRSNTVRDLDKTLKFIGAWHSQQHWTRLLQPSFMPELQNLLDRIVIRATKAAVANELTIPPQEYFVVPIQQGPVEQHFYEMQVEAAMEELGVPSQQPTQTQLESLDISTLRSWFRKLRMACIHPQIGHLQMHGGVVGGAFKSIDDVLKDMKYQSWGGAISIQRSLRMVRTRFIVQHHTQLRLSLLLHKVDTAQGNEERLALLKYVHTQSKLLENVVSDAIRRQDELGIATELGDTAQSDEHQQPQEDLKGKRREITPVATIQIDLLNDAVSGVAPETRLGRTNWQHLMARRSAMVNRLREIVELQHRAVFFLGDFYHQAQNTDEENRWYNEAENLRKRLLKESEMKVKKYMDMSKGFLKRLAGKPRQLELCGKGGIMTDNILSEANEAMPYLDGLQTLISELRANIIEHLTFPLNAEPEAEAGADGHEYDRSLESQARIETYLQAYELLLADRLKVLNGQHSLVETQRVGKNRPELLDTEEGTEPSGLAPEKSTARELANVEKRSDIKAEVAIASAEGGRLKKLVSGEEKAMSTLQTEMVTFRQTFNARIVYYRQLQALSDSVVDIEWTQDELPMSIARCRGQISDEEEELKRSQSKNRYLEFVSKKMSNEEISKEDRCCQICQTDFDNGFITNCGHVFCRECMDMWLKRRRNTCPACRGVLNNNTLHRVGFGPTASETTQVQDEQGERSAGLPISRSNIKYRVYDPKQFAQFECQGQYGEKGVSNLSVDRLYRFKPSLDICSGLKSKNLGPSLSYSQVGSFGFDLPTILHKLTLHSLGGLVVRLGAIAFRAFGQMDLERKVTLCKTLGTKESKCYFCMGKEKENSGMNITCASNVFLVEPVVSHTFELQAIARVDRLGQTRATKVFCYYCNETVEKNILDLAVLQEKSLYVAQGRVAKYSSSIEEAGLKPKKVAGMRGDYVTESRLIVKNLPAYVDDTQLRKHFTQASNSSALRLGQPSTLVPLNLTDVRLARRSDGQSRRFAFLGYKTNDEAAAAKAYFDRTYIGGSRISVEVVDSTKAQEPKKKRARATSDQAPQDAAPASPTKSVSKPDPKPSKLQRDFMDAFAPRAKGRSWLDNDIPPGGATNPGSSQPDQDASKQDASESEPDDASLRNDRPATMSDLDWMRSRMKNSLDGEPFTGKVFTQDDADIGDATERPSGASAWEPFSEEPGESPHSTIQTRRLFLRNLAYVCTEEDIRAEFSRFGSIEQVHIPLTVERTSKGLAYVTFSEISSATQALEAMDRTSFQGRLLHVMPAIVRAGKEEADARESSTDRKKSVKKERDTKRKENAGREFNWGMLYMNSDAILSSVADRLKISKANILDPEATNASVRLALAETNVIEETKAFLEMQGVSLDSFKSRERSDTIILVKNIPYGTTAEDLRNMFSPFGELLRLLLPPSGTLGVVEFAHSVDAGKAFKAIAYRRIKDSIIYLERGPAKMFTRSPSDQPKAAKDTVISSAVEPIIISGAPDDNAEIPPGTTLFVKNLAFATTDENLNSTFRSLPGFAFARVQTKPDPKQPGSRLSMGFGFIGFKSVESAQRALAGMQGAVIDGHTLQVKFAKRGEVPEGAGTATVGSSKTTKVIVKNLPFEATKKDVRELFGYVYRYAGVDDNVKDYSSPTRAYGQLKSVRVPRKFNSNTRGFAFLDFISRREAESAFNTLQHTHLLGRHLVLEWAEDGAVNVEQLRDNVKVGWGDGASIPGRKRKVDMLNGADTET
ncbi:Multiple RNA-binding domain-containing protein 1 [Ceratobasidium sp. 414]|nr:Multiple RNA-binding domain-containing protein 1 [Ceratobasidium sp. 414]